MIVFIDTGAFFGLADDTDEYHLESRNFYEKVAEKERLLSSLPVIVETWQLLETRLGIYQANRFWKWILEGYVEILSVDSNDLSLAFEIETKYADAGLGIVDSTTFALCERHKIETVFTFDRKHFSLYQPKFTNHLKLVPDL